MTQEERMEMLSQVASGLAKVLGSETEVAVHDLESMRLRYVANGYITGREAGCMLDEGVSRSIEALSDKDGHLVGYASRTTRGKKLRSSHLLFRDEDGKPAAMLCINQDVAVVENMIQQLSNSIRINVQESGETECHQGEEDYIQKMTQDVIQKSAERMNPMELTTREGKLELLRRLKFQGVFDVKDAIPYVCNVISVSQATLYNYLRELRSEEENEPIEKLKVK